MNSISPSQYLFFNGGENSLEKWAASLWSGTQQVAKNSPITSFIVINFIGYAVLNRLSSALENYFQIRVEKQKSQNFDPATSNATFFIRAIIIGSGIFCLNQFLIPMLLEIAPNPGFALFAAASVLSTSYFLNTRRPLSKDDKDHKGEVASAKFTLNEMMAVASLRKKPKEIVVIQEPATASLSFPLPLKPEPLVKEKRDIDKEMEKNQSTEASRKIEEWKECFEKITQTHQKISSIQKKVIKAVPPIAEAVENEIREISEAHKKVSESRERMVLDPESKDFCFKILLEETSEIKTTSEEVESLIDTITTSVITKSLNITEVALKTGGDCLKAFKGNVTQDVTEHLKAILGISDDLEKFPAMRQKKETFDEKIKIISGAYKAAYQALKRMELIQELCQTTD